MEVIYTDQSYDSLEDLSDFLLDELGWTSEKLLEFRTKLLDKADALETTFNNYQQEEYLEHLGKNHRRVIEGHAGILTLVGGRRHGVLSSKNGKPTLPPQP